MWPGVGCVAYGRACLQVLVVVHAEGCKPASTAFGSWRPIGEGGSAVGLAQCFSMMPIGQVPSSSANTITSTCVNMQPLRLVSFSPEGAHIVSSPAAIVQEMTVWCLLEKLCNETYPLMITSRRF